MAALMGDDLAELLFSVFHDGDCDWNGLELKIRGAWERVAAKARAELNLRFRRDMRDAVAEYGAGQAIANLLGRGEGS